jgi:hypothetical protein
MPPEITAEPMAFICRSNGRLVVSLRSIGIVFIVGPMVLDNAIVALPGKCAAKGAGDAPGHRQLRPARPTEFLKACALKVWAAWRW